MNIAIDFDGTIVENRYPAIGNERPFAIATLKRLQADKHNLVLWTVREGRRLDEALAWCRERGLEFYAVNRDYPEEEREANEHYSRKLKVDLFVDDRNVGGLPDWGTIYDMISRRITIDDLLDARSDEPSEPERPKRRGLRSLFGK